MIVIHHLRIWGRLYSMFLALWLLQNFVPSAYQGADSELGQKIYTIATNIEGALDIMHLLEKIGIDWFKR